MFNFTAIFPLLFIAPVFYQAAFVLDGSIQFNKTVTVAVRQDDIPYAGTGGPMGWCFTNDKWVASALNTCNATSLYDIVMTFPTQYPRLPVVLHELIHGLGFMNVNNSLYSSLVLSRNIGYVKLSRDLSHIDDKSSVMYPSETDIEYIDSKTLFVLQQLGYTLQHNATSSSVDFLLNLWPQIAVYVFLLTEILWQIIVR